jgi:uroporphyrin-III C-methyltransferase/precorrin-2 dehydrogenase/sirohydrochlorin ferrochelatase
VIGHVSLVGAGPGDPDLLTLRAARRLAEADLVLYDALVSREARAMAPEARWFYVGKRAGRESIGQEAINRLLVRAARRGFCVVRLKSGDPFVLGRGGEEALALVEAGIPFEVIPGVSSAVAAPALAGIPITHRGLASGFLVVSGHAEAAWAPALGSLAPGSATVVVLMGLGARSAVVQCLLAHGWDAATPAAIVASAATSEAWRWLGRLDELAAAELPAGAPGILVIGAVAALAPTLQSQFGPLAEMRSRDAANE